MDIIFQLVTMLPYTIMKHFLRWKFRIPYCADTENIILNNMISIKYQSDDSHLRIRVWHRFMKIIARTLPVHFSIYYHRCHFSIISLTFTLGHLSNNWYYCIIQCIPISHKHIVNKKLYPNKKRRYLTKILRGLVSILRIRRFYEQ